MALSSLSCLCRECYLGHVTPVCSRLLRAPLALGDGIRCWATPLFKRGYYYYFGSYWVITQIHIKMEIYCLTSNYDSLGSGSHLILSYGLLESACFGTSPLVGTVRKVSGLSLNVFPLILHSRIPFQLIAAIFLISCGWKLTIPHHS